MLSSSLLSSSDDDEVSSSSSEPLSRNLEFMFENEKSTPKTHVFYREKNNILRICMCFGPDQSVIHFKFHEKINTPPLNNNPPRINKRRKNNTHQTTIMCTHDEVQNIVKTLHYECNLEQIYNLYFRLVPITPCHICQCETADLCGMMMCCDTVCHLSCLRESNRETSIDKCPQCQFVYNFGSQWTTWGHWGIVTILTLWLPEEFSQKILLESKSEGAFLFQNADNCPLIFPTLEKLYFYLRANYEESIPQTGIIDRKFANADDQWAKIYFANRSFHAMVL